MDHPVVVCYAQNRLVDYQRLTNKQTLILLEYTKMILDECITTCHITEIQHVITFHLVSCSERRSGLAVSFF